MRNLGILLIQLILVFSHNIQLTFANFVSDVKTIEPGISPVTLPSIHDSLP